MEVASLLSTVHIDVDPTETRIVVQCELRDRELMQKIPGARWQDGPRVWHCYLSWAAMLQLRGRFGQRLEIGERLKELAWQVYERRVKPALELRDAKDAEGDNRLSPLQRVGAQWFGVSSCGILADPQGSGKTPQTISGLAGVRDPFPALIVSPAPVKAHWQKQFKRWWPQVDVAVSKGDINKRRAAIESVRVGECQVLVMNWESIRAHTRLAPYGKTELSDKEKLNKELNAFNFQTVIGDEIQHALNPKSKMTRALWAVGDPAKHRFALSGTLGDETGDLWSIGRFIAPEEYPSKTRWIDLYALKSFNFFGGLEIVGLKAQTKEELFAYLDPRLLRRPKAIILPELEGKAEPRTLEVELLPKQKKAYKALQKDMLVQLEGGTLMETNPMLKMQRLRTLAGATGVIDESGDLQLTEPSSKIDALVETIRDLEPREKVAVFAVSKKLLKVAQARLEKEKIEAVMFTGDEKEDVREANRELFQDPRSDIRVILGTFGAMAEGVDLSMMDLEVFLEKDWSLIKQGQAEERGDRLRPDGTSRPGKLRLVYIVASATVDEDVQEALENKGAQWEEILRDEEALKKWLS